MENKIDRTVLRNVSAFRLPHASVAHKERKEVGGALLRAGCELLLSFFSFGNVFKKVGDALQKRDDGSCRFGNLVAIIIRTLHVECDTVSGRTDIVAVRVVVRSARVGRSGMGRRRLLRGGSRSTW